MESYNGSVWKHYQPGFVDDTFIPYLRERTEDAWGNQVEINMWKDSLPATTVQPELVRINKGMSFMKMFEEDPCPVGFQKDPVNMGYCIKEELRHEPVFYTEKAFIPLKQYFNGPADNGGVRKRVEDYRRVSEQTDMRSVNPMNGQYTVYFQPLQSSSNTRYVNPTTGPEKYDASWNFYRQSSYAKMATGDSYLG
jgi:hypothetical protein